METTDEAVVGVDLGGTNVRVAKVRGERLERRHKRRISSRATEETVLHEVFEAIDSVIDDEVAGIGCGVPSVIDLETGTVYDVENIPSWREVPLKDKLERRYKIPAIINNDANAFALGEKYFGKAKSYRNIVGVTIGTGLGAGVLIDGRLYSGSNCGAGEIGVMPYREHNIEYYCAGQFFQREAGMPGEEVYRRAQEGDQEALQHFEAFGRELGHAIMIVLYAYDPEMIVLGGSISKCFPLFEDGMRERLQEYAYQQSLQSLVLECSDTEDVALLGAAALYLDANASLGRSH